MSYEEFRKRIDTARQILVGAVPSPAGQIDQITYALMYKFMNDIDDQAAALGGKRTYFTGDYAKYNWHELMKPGLEAHDQLELYRQAIQGMSKNPGLPPLFREIYQNAFLPFNSPNVLRLFLEEINKFNHGDSDDIGDAYEYLLSITGAQGDVGQFRTPRHIIKFIVEAVNPSKDDTVLDPAVGTAGFLIAAYNHVKSQHDGKDGRGNANDEKRLTADELEKLHHNYRGFDIDPTMVRTASVNMYLHGFTSPDIRNHDSLSSEDYWNDRYDVILANPPFMTPKGGIQPHKKFSITANRAEVLFVDYIASHLKPNGRAGVIVPEGIIFQSGKAYKELRKNLVENYLYAVVSLPAGVFQPYSGVKTSVLLMDKQLAKEHDEILFVKVENDGYSLGAQRRRDMLHDQLPAALDATNLYKENHHQNSAFSHTVSRKSIAESGDYSLSGDRYKATGISVNNDYPLVKLGDKKYFQIESGGTPSSKEPSYWDGDINWATLVDLPANNHITHIKETERKITQSGLSKSSAKLLPIGTVLVSSRATIGRVAIADVETSTNQGFKNIIVNPQYVIPEYVANVLTQMTEKLKSIASGGTFAEFSKTAFESIEIPLPPIEIQHEIVAELDGYQKIIDAAQTIVKTYKPTIKIDPDWDSVSYPEVVFIQEGPGIRSYEYDDSADAYPIINVRCVKDGYIDTSDGKKVKRGLAEGQWKHFQIDEDDILFTISGTIGRSALVGASDLPLLMNTSVVRFKTKDEERLINKYLYYYVGTEEYIEKLKSMSTGMAQLNVGPSHIKTMSIPLPPIEVQREIVTRLEAEQQLIGANKKLIEIYRQKIKTKLAEIWGE